MFRKITYLTILVVFLASCTALAPTLSPTQPPTTASTAVPQPSAVPTAAPLPTQTPIATPSPTALAPLKLSAQKVIDPGGQILSLSPNGQYLLVKKTDRVCVLDLAANAETGCTTQKSALVMDVPTIAWSPDSRTIAFTENVRLYLFEPDLWTMDAATAKLADLTDDNLPPETAFLGKDIMPNLDQAPAWLPSGGSLAFARTHYNDPQNSGTSIFSIPEKGGTPTLLLTADKTAPMAVSTMLWSPDGKTLYYNFEIGDPKDPKNGIWSSQVNSAKAAQLYHADPIVGPARLTAVDSSGRYGLVLLLQAAASPENAKGSPWALLDLQKGTTTGIVGAAPGAKLPLQAALSPDGAWVAYTYQAADGFHLAVRDLALQQETTLALSADPFFPIHQFNPGVFWANNHTLLALIQPGKTGLLVTFGK